MTDNRQSVTTEDLHAYADGRLPPERAEAVEAYLSEQPERAAEVEDYRRINRALGEAFEGILDEPLPAAQVALVQHRPRRLAVPLMAAAAGLLLGIGLTWSAQTVGFGAPAALGQLAATSAAAYGVYAPEIRHPVEVGAAEAGHLSAWLSNRMGMSFRIPRLGDLGFDLVGGRLMIGDHSPAALLMYENAEGRRLVLYVRNDLTQQGASAPIYTRARDTGVVSWISGETGYGLAGGFSEGELLPAARLVQAQLSS
ncbi:MAG TPA: anti-sigma factor [Kiloniellaceae bacterium]|nr:anti-sigma factor [Kiloniellaceae bacterium]